MHAEFAPLAIEGHTPLVISLPHVGTGIPAALRSRMTAAGSGVPDTDWHVERLYAFARAGGCSWLEARVSRYVIDLNRPPDDAALYAGQVATGLCPVVSFAGEPLYAGAAPDPAEIEARRVQHWEPYHAALAALLEAAKARHGYAVLLDAHSIRSRVPRLFEGRLPDINLGTHAARSCDPALTQALQGVLAAQRQFSHVLDGRFKGGYITRAYGRPQQGVHAVQIELAQAAYMDEEGGAFEPVRAAPLGRVLGALLDALDGYRPPAGNGR
jgi:N-formylglutamate deformylase